MKKPSVTFWLKKTAGKESDKPVLIMLNFSYHSLRCRLSTGLTIKPSNWHKKNSLPKTSFADYSSYKSTLRGLEEDMLEIYDGYAERGIIPEPATLKIEMQQRQAQHKGSLTHEADVKSIHHFFNEFVDEKCLEVKELTLKKYATLQNVLLQQFEELNKCTLSFDTMDLLFEKKFKYMLHNHRNTCNNA
ncbi:hypothetical protein OB13_14935, partial [Pontibacter sp. HJ8]